MTESLLVLFMGAAVAGFVQGLSGFAFGLVSLSIWAWFLDPKLAAALAVTGALTGQITAAFTVRRKLDWRALAPFLLGGLVGVPVGVWVLPMLNLQLFKACLGAMLLIWCPFMLLATRMRPVRGSRLGDGVVGWIGGFMGGVGGFTGAIPTLWCTLRQLPRDEARAIIQNFNLVMLIVAMLLYVAQGLVVASQWISILAIVPVVLITSRLGAHVYIGLSEVRFRQIILVLLTLSGLAMLASSLPKLL
ncbi:sulfite exporter TauE/SafE family protein [Curvibacter sp. CHRR-16]|uniref:sulfite exporter TauE/SafE family protein n=1 Tax=Curvibacter sp. CHRR-16 TaxID=2835872 RepID=UPI001BD96906|nr:sulfite exporter TauE/SafE family protein [Curvibacter sp. CHRR-16]MBT0571057.1 sulfite exporter TauE/SafE family protein [Curvibacter sp. CHRR-16]